MNEAVTQQEASNVKLETNCNFPEPVKNKCKKTIRHKICFVYNSTTLAFTQRQFYVLDLIAKGYSNSRIAIERSVREEAVKIFVHRLIKKLEESLHEKVDRFSLVILAQKLKAEYDLYCLISSQDNDC